MRQLVATPARRGKEVGEEEVDGKIKGEGRMGPKFARLLSDARPSASTDAIGHLGREGRMRAVARRVEEWPRDGSSAGPRRARSADRDLLGGAIDPWPLPVQTLCSFVDRDRAPR